METIISSIYSKCESFKNISHLNHGEKNIYVYAVRDKIKANDQL